MLTEEQIELLGEKLVPLYQELEQEVIADIARRVKKTGTYTETAEIMAKSLMEQGYSPAQMQKEVMKLIRADKAYQRAVAENTKEYKDMVTAEIKRIVSEAKEQGNNIVAQAGSMAFNNDLSLWEQAGKTLQFPNGFKQLINAMALQTNKDLRNLTRTLGFKGLGFTALENAYQHQLDLGLIKLTSGAYSWQQIVNDCVIELAQSGLRSIDYKSGRTMQLDTAVRNCIMTSSSQLAGQVMIMNMEATGSDLVEVSSHWGARSGDGGMNPSNHLWWQGQVYSLSGRDKRYKKLETITGYLLDPRGLHGYNCRHTFYVFFDGISKPTKWEKEPYPLESSGRTYTYYQATQKQRQMERNIRATKREIEAQNSLGGDVTELNSKLKKQMAEYKQFSSDVNMRPKNERLRVQAGSSDLKKTNAFKSYEKLVKQREHDKIELEKYAEMLKNKSVIVKGKDDHFSLPMTGKEDSITDLVNEDGKVQQRRVYGPDKRADVDYDTTDHNKPKYHPEGAHKHIYNYENKNPHSSPKKLTELDLKKNEDIIRKGENHHES